MRMVTCMRESGIMEVGKVWELFLVQIQRLFIKESGRMIFIMDVVG